MMKLTEEGDIGVNSPKAWILAARPKTLAGAAVPVMIGVALAVSDADPYGGCKALQPVAALLCLLFAFIMQIDANFVNDFFDYANGNDDREKRLGPKRACAEGWVTLNAMKHAIAATTILACLVGLPLVYYGGLEMLLVGILCVVFCFLYTTWLASRGLGDLLVIIFFGLIPVATTYYIQLHTLTLLVLWASLACGIVIDSLLTINNFRDRDNDRQSGKITLVVKVGERGGLRLYLATGWVACLMGLAFWFSGNVLAFLLPLVYLVLHNYTYLKIKRIRRGRALNECLGETSRNIFLYGLLLSSGLLLL